MPNHQYSQIEKLCSVWSNFVSFAMTIANTERRIREWGSAQESIPIIIFCLFVCSSYKYAFLKLQLKTGIHKIPRNFKSTCSTKESFCLNSHRTWQKCFLRSSTTLTLMVIGSGHYPCFNPWAYFWPWSILHFTFLI